MTPDPEEVQYINLEQIERVGGLLPEITESLDPVESYRKRWIENLNRAKMQLADSPGPYVKSKEFLKVHGELFKGMTDFGGETSSDLMGCGGDDIQIIGAEPEDMKKELKLLDKQMEVLWKEADTVEAKVRVLSFQHARYLGIHSLRDGNKRTSRAVTDKALCLLSGLKRDVNKVDRSTFNAAATEAIRYNNLGRLSQIIAQEYRIPYTGATVHIAPYVVGAGNPKELTLAKSQLAGIESIRSDLSLKNKWITPDDFTRILHASHGKKTRKFDQVVEKLSKKLSNPMTVGESVEVLKEFAESEVIVPRYIWSNKINPDVYLNTLCDRRSVNTNDATDMYYAGLERTRLGHALKYAPGNAQDQFRDLLEKQMTGEVTKSEVDAYHKSVFDGGLERKMMAAREEMRRQQGKANARATKKKKGERAWDSSTVTEKMPSRIWEKESPSTAPTIKMKQSR